jgi:hypothetical protein
MSRRQLPLSIVAVLALFVFVAPASAKSTSAFGGTVASTLFSPAPLAEHALHSVSPDSQSQELCCFRRGCEYGGGWEGWGYPGYGWGDYYPWYGYWPAYYIWWPYGYYWYTWYPAYYGYWWQYPWWGYPMSTYYWWNLAPRTVPVPAVPAQSNPPVKAASAESLYTSGLTAYWEGDAARASEFLAAAVRSEPSDARIWYFKALAERAAGHLAMAEASARRGAALEVLHSPDSSQMSVALERVQGPSRDFLRSAMTADLTFEKAREIAALPVDRVPALAKAK